MKSLIFALVLITSVTAHADCVCRCVNGEVEPICSSTLDIKPICAPRICPIVRPAIKPIEPLTIPPIGTKKCELKQVWNPNTEKYEWQELCIKAIRQALP